MRQFDYTFSFSTVQNKMERVTVVDKQLKQSQFQIAFNDKELLSNLQAIPGVVSDLVDLAVSVATADRIAQRNDLRHCEICIRLPIRTPERFDEQLQMKLQDVLYWFTGDYWTFEFTETSDYIRTSQYRMEPDPDDAEVALWSGGLDSAAGLCRRLAEGTAKRYVLFGTGSNSAVYSVQQRVAKEVQRVHTDTILLKRALLRLSDTSSLHKHSDQRSRGFVFLLMGAACAHLEGQDVLHIYENGVAAINLQFRDSEVGLDHTRSVNPISLLKIGELVSLALGKQFGFQNPFQFCTKAKMCEVFLDSEMAKIPALTVTCDRWHRQKELPVQCGICSSCLLRRQALSAAGVNDFTKYIINHRPHKSGDDAYLRAMLYQVETFRGLLANQAPWELLAKRYEELSAVADVLALCGGITTEVVQDKLISLYSQYVAEWDTAHTVVSSTLNATGSH